MQIVVKESLARARILQGAELLYDAVKTTMGPRGRNVIITNPYGLPTLTHDGVTVAKAVNLVDTEENAGKRAGIELIKSAASQMNDNVGDGTTTVTVLTYHILEEAHKLIAAGHNPMELKKQLDGAAKDVLKALQTIAEEVSDVSQVATISAGDYELGKLIAEVVEKVGKDGIVTVEEGTGLAVESEIVEGFTFDKGYASPYMVTNNDKMEAVYDNPAVLVTDKRLTLAKEVVPILELLHNNGQNNLVVFADEVEGEALSTLVVNKLKGTFNTVVVKAPSYAERRLDFFDDIATLTGATVLSDDSGLNTENVDLDAFGAARRVVVKKDETTIVSGSGDVKDRVKTLTNLIETMAPGSDRDWLYQRRGRLNGHVGVIKVGGATETEIEETKFRVDDAVAATKAALAEGIVPGGGTTPLYLSSCITSKTPGAELLKKALKEPFRTLLNNSGINADSWIVQAEVNTGKGIDVTKPDGLVDLKEAGIIDPVKVTKEAIINAVSVAGNAMTVGAIIVDVPEDRPAQGQDALPVLR